MACKRRDADSDDDSEIWQTPESWLEQDGDDLVAFYPFKNRQSCARNYVDKHNPLGGKNWDIYRVTTLYFPEVHTTCYKTAEKLCRIIGERPVTDEETRKKKMTNALLAFSVRGVMGEMNLPRV